MPTPDRSRRADSGPQSQLAWLRGSALVLLVAVLLLSGLFAEDRLRRQIEPDLTGLAYLIADDLAQQVARAVDAGVPAERLVGMPAFFDQALVADERVRAAALVDAAGTPLHRHDPDALLADLLPDALPAAGHRIDGDRLIVVQPLLPPGSEAAEDAAALRLLVAVHVELLNSSLVKLWASLLLLGIALTIAGALLLDALLDLIWYQPRALLLSVAKAVQAGDFALSLPSAPGELGRVVARVEERLKAANAAYLALRLAAFGTRSGNFEPSVLKALRTAEDEAIEGLHFAAERGARRLQPSERGLPAAASFLLLLPEAILIGAGDASGLPELGSLLAVLCGAGFVLLCRRSLSSLLSRQLAYAFGALLAALCLFLSLFMPHPFDGLARLGSGAGYGLALLAICRSRPGAASLATSLLAALACGLAAGLFLDVMLAADWAVAFGFERGAAVLSVVLLLLAALLGGSTLPATSDGPNALTTGAAEGLPSLFCASAAGLLLLPAWQGSSLTGPGAFALLPPMIVALPVAWVLLSALRGAFETARVRAARASVVVSILAVLLLGLSALGGPVGLEQSVVRSAMSVSLGLLLMVPALASLDEGETSCALAPLAFAGGLLAAIALPELLGDTGDLPAGLLSIAFVLALAAAALIVRRGFGGRPLAERAP